MFDPDPRPSVLRLGDTIGEAAKPTLRPSVSQGYAAAAACAGWFDDRPSFERLSAELADRPAAQSTKSFHHLFDGFKRPTEQTDKQHLARVAQADPIAVRHAAGLRPLVFRADGSVDPLDGLIPLDAPRHHRPLDLIEKRMHHIADDADARWIAGMIVVEVPDGRTPDKAD